MMGYRMKVSGCRQSGLGMMRPYAHSWYGHQILVWPIAALRNELSTNKKGVFSVKSLDFQFAGFQTTS
jgi:hypothetical protein